MSQEAAATAAAFTADTTAAASSDTELTQAMLAALAMEDLKPYFATVPPGLAVSTHLMMKRLPPAKWDKTTQQALLQHGSLGFWQPRFDGN
jgi:hypothetical protein